MHLFFSLILSMISFSAFAIEEDFMNMFKVRCDRAINETQTQAFYMGSVTYSCANKTKVKLDYTPSLSHGSVIYESNGETLIQSVTHQGALNALTSHTLYQYKESEEYKLKKQYEYRLPVRDIKSDYR